MAKILIVEDDDFLGSAIRSAVESSGYQVVLAVNGKKAIEELTAQSFDCVISDVQMPVMDGLQLLKWVRANRKIPFIFMTGHSDNMDSQSAVTAGAVDFILKPFSEKDLIRVIALALNQRTGSTFDPLALGYCRVQGGALFSQGAANFNIYIQKDGGLMKIATRGEPVNAQTLIDLGTAAFYIERDNLSALIPLNLMMTKAALKNQTVDANVKIDFMRHTTQLLQEKIKFDGLDPAAFDQASEYIQCTLQNIDALPVYALLTALGDNDDVLAINGLGVTCLSLMIAGHLGWAPAEMFMATIAGFFHDIGKLQLPAEICRKPRHLLNPTEIALLDDHPRLGRDQLLKTELFDHEIPDIVYQHHENSAGTGYPEKCRRESIHPIARLLHLADTFCKLVLRSPSGPGMPAEKAIAQMNLDPSLDGDYFAVLKTLLAGQKQKAG
jgi:response regulator RpfG family c-di-GMP phosphodiesterase